MPDYLLVSFNFQGRTPSTDNLAPALSQALDWVRYAPNCWIVWTSASADDWYARLRPLLRDDDSVFICKLDIRNRAGYLPGLVWDWLDRERLTGNGNGIAGISVAVSGGGIDGAAAPGGGIVATGGLRVPVQTGSN
jgi:hypothetical protein